MLQLDQDCHSHFGAVCAYSSAPLTWPRPRVVPGEAVHSRC
nr:MAG TPA: hypothetical protein [Caudoviricetes sp.]